MPRIVLIGLDSADAVLIDRWCRSGHLPVLASLRSDGAWARLKTSAEVMHVSAWPTLYTGASPGRHGLYHAYQVRPGEQGVHRTRPRDCPLPPFWKYLDDAGLRCIVFDAFMDYPLRDFHGVQVLEYGTWTWFGKPGSTPSNARSRLIGQVGPYPAPEHLHVLSVPDPARFRDQLIAGARAKAEATRWLLREHDWDLAFVTFGEPHGAGHYLWHTGDPDHPASRDYDISGAADALRDVYVAVDGAIGSILETIDDSTVVAVFSGDGMGPNYSGCHHMPGLLREKGWLYDGEGARAVAAAPTIPARNRLLSRLRKAIPLPARQAISRCLPRSVHYRMSMKWVNDGIDWERSRVFCIPNSNEAYFRMNLKGREPLGRVDPDAEALEIVGELRDDLRKLINPDNGKLGADRVLAIDAVYPGPERGRLPDVVAGWNPDARILGRLASAREGLLEGAAGYQTAPYYTGNHRPNAFLLVRGPDTPAGVEVNGRDVLDVAPTILAKLGVELPVPFEGAPVAGLM